MKKWVFSLPSGAEDAAFAALQQSQLLRADGTPGSLVIERENQFAICLHAGQEGGTLQIPFDVAGFGHVVISAASLIPREEPYRLILELARGQLSQVRDELADIVVNDGLELSAEAEIHNSLESATKELSLAVFASDVPTIERHAASSLRRSLELAELIAVRRARWHLEHTRATRGRWGVVLNGGREALRLADELGDALEHVVIPPDWNVLEPSQGAPDWDVLDAKIAWAFRRKLPITMGPVVDFRSAALPGWLETWKQDPPVLTALLIDFAETLMTRYHDRVARWVITARTNSTSKFSLPNHQYFQLTRTLLESLRRHHHAMQCVVGIDQPWGEYAVSGQWLNAPLAFVDGLLRMATPLDAVQLEIAMGYGQGGTFCRSLLHLSRLLDRFSELGAALDVLLSFPSQPPKVMAGRWHDGPCETTQAEWAEQATLIALSKTKVRHVAWLGLVDAASGADWPHSGLYRADDVAKPIRDRFVALRRWLGGLG